MEKIPTENYCVFIEGGSTFSGKLIKYDGFQWNIVSINLPLYNFIDFRHLVASTLQNIIFTDTNIELLYAVENCNTTVIPTSAILPIKTFFDNIITNEIG